MHLTILLFHPSVPCSKLMKQQANIMVQWCQKCYRVRILMPSYMSLYYKVSIALIKVIFCHIAFLNILLFITVKLEKI